ncbi:MAG: hypothetical protein HYX47_11845 [Burkholderiales bacterium]|nr:hypothetical protein [Burkholderiales bacterium]
MRIPSTAIPGAAKALWMALAFGTASGACLAFQSAVSFKVTVQVPWVPSSGGGGTGGIGAVCRTTGSVSSVDCTTGGGTGGVVPVIPVVPVVPVTPTSPVTVGPVPVSTPLPTPLPQPVPTVTAEALQPLAEVISSNAEWQQVLAAGGWRAPAELAGRPALPVADPGISGVFGAVASSRMVTFGGRDYLEMTVSW